MTTPAEAPSGQQAQQQNSNTEPEFGSDEYDAAFDAVAKKIGALSEPGAKTVVADDDDGGGGDEDPPGSKTADDDGGGGDDNKTQPGAGSSASDPGKSEPASAAPAKAADGKPAEKAGDKKQEGADDPLAKLPEYQRAEVQKMLDAERAKARDLEHKFLSAQGRIARLEKRTPGAAKAAPDAASGDAKTGGAPSAKSERYQEFERTYPEIAQAFEERIGELAAQLPPAEQIEFLREARETQLVNSRITAVQAVHPQFLAAVKAPEFDAWAGQQSDLVKRLINSDNPEEVCVAMDLFVASHPQYKGQPSASAGSSTAASQPKTPSPEESKLRERRSAQLAAVDAGAKGNNPPSVGEGEDEYEAMFQRHAKKASAALNLPYRP